MKNKKLFAILTLVCFLMTLMPVAAFAGDPVADTLSSVIVKDSAVEVGEAASFDLELVTSKGDYAESLNDVYIWASEKGKYLPTDVNYTISAPKHNVELKSDVAGYDVEADPTEAYTITFDVAGEYDIHVAQVFGDVNGEVREFKSSNRTIKVTAKDEEVKNVVANPKNLTVVADGVAYTKTLTFEGDKGTLRNEAVSFTSNRQNLVVTADAAKTNVRGEIDVKLVAKKAGTYVVTATIAGNDVKIPVTATGTAPVKVVTKSQPKDLIAKDSNFAADDVVEFEMRDINNNVVANTEDVTVGEIKVIEANVPAKSKLKKENFTVNPEGVLVSAANFDTEGKYSVKVQLTNSASVAEASWEVKAKGDAVKLDMGVDSSVVFSTDKATTIEPSFKYVDANGLETALTAEEIKALKFYATGRAIKSASKDKVTLKTDEKYLGQEITLYAIDEDKDLKATVTVKLVEDSRNIAFDDATLETYTTNKVEWNIVDAAENKVTFGSSTGVVVDYYVLNKPAGSEVTVKDATASSFKGNGAMEISCDKPGNVTVQVVAQVGYRGDTEYYVGTKVFAVGNGSVGDVVVMTIGTNKLVKNGEFTEMDATPIIKDNRTFVPFRALIEAFGADVAYNEADKTVTATLDGTTVVMTIGSNAYTVNGAEKTMDVAPYIDGERTMVPVRFVAEAFGIDVTAVPDVTDGTTASVIFNK